jgi:hypothetical protein
MNSKATATMTSLLVCLMLTVTATADIFQDFEDSSQEGIYPGYRIYAQGTTSTYVSEVRASQAGEPALGNTSIRLELADIEDGNITWVGCGVGSQGVAGKLKDLTNFSFEYYHESGSTSPYLSLRLDMNGNGVYDGYATDWGLVGLAPTITPGANGWETRSMDSTTSGWHLIGGDDEMGGTYWGDTLEEFAALEYNSTPLGEMDVIVIYAEAGTLNSDAYDMVGYVDNIQATPEPATMSLLGLGGLAMLRRRRRNRK